MEKIITQRPIYGPMYRYYWIKDVTGDIIWGGSTYEEQQLVLKKLYDNDVKNVTHGYGIKQDIIGYETTEKIQKKY